MFNMEAVPVDYKKLVEAGGIESILIYFANTTVRTRDTANSHSKAFKILLKTAQQNNYHLTKFLDELNGLKLVEFILVHPNCKVSEQMLTHYLDFCLVKCKGFYCIQRPKLIYHLLSSWRAWHRDTHVAKCLYRRLIRISQLSDNPMRLKTNERKLEQRSVNHNLRTLSDLGGIDILVAALRECLVPLDENPPHLDHELVELIVKLISLLIRRPPEREAIIQLVEFLIFLHPDTKAYVEANPVDDWPKAVGASGYPEDGDRCSCRNYAVAQIADVLASIVSPRENGQLIEVSKLIILANSDSSLVREKVLKLFLLCICAHEDNHKTSSFKICLPMQLMARQLLKYSTTIKMVQICYELIVEAVSPNTQANTLILFIQLMTKLHLPEGAITLVKFVHAHVKQLLQPSKNDALAFLVDNGLLDCWLKLYFNLGERETEADDSGEGIPWMDGGDIHEELDQVLILVTRFLIQSKTLGSIEELLLQIDLMNTQLATEYKQILRDRMVKIIGTLVLYCRYYERVARHRSCSGRVEYYIRSIFRSTNLNTFPNVLSDSQLNLSEDHELNSFSSNSSCAPISVEDDKMSSCSLEGSEGSDLLDEHYENGSAGARFISEGEVLDRIRKTYEFVVNLITAREQGVIPSPLERAFIIECVKLLAGHLENHQKLVKGQLEKKKQRSQWFSLLSKLEVHLKSSFSQLILSLLSPCDSMNIDERKYFAFKLLEIFSVDQLLNLLQYSGGDTAYRVLLPSIIDLLDFDSSPTSSPDSSREHDDDGDEDDKMLGDETELKLKQLVRAIEIELSDSAAAPKVTQIDTKFLKVWIDDLGQRQEERLRALKAAESQSQAVESIDGDRMIDEALEIGRDFVKEKHKQRKAYLEYLKQKQTYNYHIRQQWLSLMIGQTHERAIWYLDSHYPKCWELNPEEGPSRIRRRLRPCKLMLSPKFLRNPSRQIAPDSVGSGELYGDNFVADDWYNQYSPHPLCAIVINNEQSMDSNKLRTRIFTTEKINFNCDCSIIRPNEVCDGEASIASWCIHFIGKRSNNYQRHLEHQNEPYRHAHDSFPSTIVEDLWFDEIVEIWDRRYQLQDVGLEIFLTNNITYLISFRTNQDREDFRRSLAREESKMTNLRRSPSLVRLIELWHDGRLTDFDYLMWLNKLAGRSFNDIMIYPVYPYVLSNYTSQALDLNKASNYRKLDKPMAIQNKDKEATFINNYQDSQSSNVSGSLSGMQRAYHYGNHYSNSATVLHYLVRLPPFTQMLIQYQDNSFDQPDRTFHSLANTWQLITRDSNTDFKELIPEFFYLPEMFMNSEQFELGRKQNDELVDDVKLPPWCPNSDPRLFTLIHRQALESAHVSENLHHWIDLIFGYKQTGDAAVEAINVFHPATYYGAIDLGASSQTLHRFSSRSTSTTTANTTTSATTASASTSSSSGSSEKAVLQSASRQADIERLALETMIQTYGQMPIQLFKKPMRQRLPTATLPIDPSNSYDGPRRPEPLRQVRGLRWGSYVCSPDESATIAVLHRKIAPQAGPIKYRLCLLPNGDIAILNSSSSLILDDPVDRKSGYQFLAPSARHSQRAGLGSVVDRIPNMIISRHVELAHISAGLLDPVESGSSASSFAPLSSPQSKLSLISWSYLDGTIRIRHPALGKQEDSLPLVQADSIVNSMSTCTSVPEMNLLLVGYKSGVICAHIVSTLRASTPVTQFAPLHSVRSMNKSSRWLYCHSKRVNCIRVSVTAGVFVSGSEDGTAVIWDLKKLTYLRTIDYKLSSCRRRSAIGANPAGDHSPDLALRGLLDFLCNCGQPVPTIRPQPAASGRETDDQEEGEADDEEDREEEADEYEDEQEHSGQPEPPEPPEQPQPEQLQLQHQPEQLQHQLRDTEQTEQTQQSCICSSGITLIAVSDTLGDIVTVKDINNRLAQATDYSELERSSATSQSDVSSMSSVVYVHTINGSLVGCVNCHTQVTAVCYSNAPEGISVNVIVVGLADGLIRLYSSWDLRPVRDFRLTGFGSPISSLLYTRDNLLLYIVYEDGQWVVLRSAKRNSVKMPKHWIL